MGLTRRQMLRGATGAFAFRADTIQKLSTLMKQSPHPDDDDFWVELRSKFDIDPNMIVFNHAGLSPSPQVVREAIAFQTKRANSDPSYVIWRQQDRELDPIRERMAKLVGCQTDELALTMNCTYGLQTGIMGVPMEASDRIVTTSHDYSRAFTAIKQRERRDKVTSTIVPISTPPEPRSKIAADVLAVMDDRTKLVLMSQMTFVSGQLMPIREVATALRPRGIPVFVDAAHGIALLSETFVDSGADIYAACLHKWLMGPIGTGVFVVRRPWISKIWPLHPADAGLDDSITKFEQTGTRSAAPFLALKETLDFHEMIGRERKAERLESLRKRLVDTLFNIPKIKLHGSQDPTVCRAVLLLAIEGVSAIDLAGQLLAKHKIHVTTMVRAGIDAIRISPNVFTTFEEIDKLASALREAAAEQMLRI